MSDDNFARFQKCAVEVLSVDEAQVTPEAVSYTHLTLPTTPYV